MKQPKYTQQEMIARLRDMADQILDPSYEGTHLFSQHLFGQIANEIERLEKENKELVVKIKTLRNQTKWHQ